MTLNLTYFQDFYRPAARPISLSVWRSTQGECLSPDSTLFGQEVLLGNANLYDPDLFENVKSAG